MSEPIFYNSINEFFKCIHLAFPDELATNQKRLQTSLSNGDTTLADELCTGCTNELLQCVKKKDSNRFFELGTDVPLVQFFGGRSLYNRLNPEEQLNYFDNNIMLDIIRVAIIIRTDKDKHGVFNSLIGTMSKKDKFDLKDPEMLGLISEMVSSPEKMKQTMDTIGSIFANIALDEKETVDSKQQRTNKKKKKKKKNNKNKSSNEQIPATGLFDNIESKDPSDVFKVEDIFQAVNTDDNQGDIIDTVSKLFSSVSSGLQEEDYHEICEGVSSIIGDKETINGLIDNVQTIIQS